MNIKIKSIEHLVEELDGMEYTNRYGKTLEEETADVIAHNKEGDKYNMLRKLGGIMFVLGVIVSICAAINELGILALSCFLPIAVGLYMYLQYNDLFKDHSPMDIRKSLATLRHKDSVGYYIFNTLSDYVDIRFIFGDDYELAVMSQSFINAWMHEGIQHQRELQAERDKLEENLKSINYN